MRGVWTGAGLTGLIVAGLIGIAGAAEVKTINPKSFYPEGPLWHGDRLLYVEYSGHTVMAWDGKENKQLWKQDGCGPAALAALDDGSLVISCYDQNTLVRLADKGDRLETIETIDKDVNGQPFLGPNDFARDGKGGLYFSASGVFDATKPIQGKIYYRASDGAIRMVADDLHYSNGLAVSPDGSTLYASEHLAARVLTFKVAADGSLSERTVFARLKDIAPDPAAADAYTGPDGLKLGPDGDLYICQYGGSRVLVTGTDGKLVRTIDVPGAYVTNVNFGATPDTVYITAATDAWTAPYPGEVYEAANR